MQGFKSFADKTRIEFDKGVTAVVGPNGSGKSNVTESLRWALGESSAKSLRGGKMPDIIFAGTESRNALNYAEVAVTLDNSDAFIKDAPKEIRVERHIYRNGDNDYLIDGKKVRLRDIHELFMDTGLGKDSFSIISQGRVEEIFNSKPEERRAIFEEAAGVLKYKTRKKETQTKLDQTQDNLDRLDDIVYELESQVAPLEKQAKVAKEFLVLDEKRKQLQINILVHDIAKDKAQEQEINEALKKLEIDLADYHKTRETIEQENLDLKRKRQKIQAEVDQKQTELLDLTKAISDVERQIELIELETSQNLEKKDQATGRIAELNLQKESYIKERTEKEADLQNLETKLSQAKANISKLSQELARFSDDPDQMIERLREDFVRLMQQEADYSNQLTATKSDIEKEKADKEHQNQEYQDTKENVGQLALKLEENQRSLKSKQEFLASLLKNYQALEQTIIESEKDYQRAQTKMFDMLDQKKAKEARQNSLESIQKNHSQFFAGVRSVLQNASQLGGIIGAVSEHLSFDQAYQTALEIALSASSQHVIVEDEAAAKRAIDFLKRNRQGRATFLPLTTIKARFLNQQQEQALQQCQGFLGTAESLVQYDSKLSDIIKNLLNTTLIFDTIDNANLAARKLQYKIRIVTLDGTELRPGGSFSGGSTRQNNTTFIRPELEQLERELSQINYELKDFELQVAKLKDSLNQLGNERDDLKAQGEAARFEEQKVLFTVQQLEEKYRDAQKLLSAFETMQETDRLKELHLKEENLMRTLSNLTIEKEKLSQEIDDIKGNKEIINEKKALISEELSQARIHESQLLSESRFEKTNLDRLTKELTDTNHLIEKLQLLLESQMTQEDVNKLPDLQLTLKDLESHKGKAEQRLVQLRFENEDTEAQLEEIEVKLIKEQEKNEGFIRQQTKLEAESEQNTERLRSYARSLAEDFQLGLEEAKSIAQEIENIALTRNELKSTQTSIKKLGPINSDAISQYDEVSERLAFLNTQKADLNKSKNLLLDTIGNMDSEVKARFKVTFEAIRESFKETFTQMFGGGTADLILTDGDLLTAGVEIAVQPPGKKIQSLNLMSGGEKALSALALLFAIIRVKTIPFVILDEVEAALDEANVKRFGDYLNRFDKDSQFIVVTHRKGTMAAADSIYGITMQESGVSKVVSVKLKDSENLSFLA